MGKQRKLVCRKRQKEGPSLWEKREARGHRVHKRPSQSSQPVAIEEGSAARRVRAVKSN